MFPNFAPSATIIIPATDKEKMIWELDCLGISKSTIFRGLDAHTVDMVERIRHHNKAINSRMVANKEK